MTIILVIGVVIAAAVVVTLAKARRGGPKKAQKWEKAEIMRQILALSESENGVAPIAPPARPRAVPARPVHPAQFSKKAGRVSQPLRSSK